MNWVRAREVERSLVQISESAVQSSGGVNSVKLDYGWGDRGVLHGSAAEGASPRLYIVLKALVMLMCEE